MKLALKIIICFFREPVICMEGTVWLNFHLSWDVRPSIPKLSLTLKHWVLIHPLKHKHQVPTNQPTSEFRAFSSKLSFIEFQNLQNLENGSMIIQFRSNEFQTIYRIESISFQNIFWICFIMNQELRTKMVSISKLFQVVMCDKFCNFGYLAFYYFCLVFILNHVSCFHITTK